MPIPKVRKIKKPKKVKPSNTLNNKKKDNLKKRTKILNYLKSITAKGTKPAERIK